MPRKERTKSGTGIYHVMLRGINRQDIFEDDEDYLQTELHSQVNEGLWCGNTPALSIDRCLLWSYTEVMKKGKMITEPSPGHSNYMFSDFALLRLSEDPKDISGYTPYYLGWDRSGQPGSPGVCIHHPKGDVKKISTVLSTPVSSSWHESWALNTHWEVEWKYTSHGHGMTQPGSSGSPLLNAMHRVIGQLQGGNSRDCQNPEGHSWYGKLSLSWVDQTNSNSIYRRLNCWLDSLNTGQTTMEGLLIIPTTQTMNLSQQLRSNIRITSNGQLTVQSNVSFMGNCRIIVESGGQLIVNAGTLSNVDVVLKPGAYLQILNGGIIYTHSGFKAQEGAIVDIQYGQIL